MKSYAKLKKEFRKPLAALLTSTKRQFRLNQDPVQDFALVPVEVLKKDFSGIPETDRLPDSSPRTLMGFKKQSNNSMGPADGQERQLMAVMIADVAGYCRLMHANETSTVKYLNTYKSIMAREIYAHMGYVVDSSGDNLMAAFVSAVNAVKCAVTIQNRIKRENKGIVPTEQMAFRIGIHLGDVICQGPYLYGNTINIAARLQSISEPGGIRISRAVHEQVEYKIDLNYCSLGERYVKNIPHPIFVYRVDNK